MGYTANDFIEALDRYIEFKLVLRDWKYNERVGRAYAETHLEYEQSKDILFEIVEDLTKPT